MEYAREESMAKKLPGYVNPMIRKAYKRLVGRNDISGVKIVDMARAIVKASGAEKMRRSRDGVKTQAVQLLKLGEVSLGEVPPKAPFKPRVDTPTKCEKETFYASWEWTGLRMKVLRKLGRRCGCCGAVAGDDVGGGVKARIVVDHIKPLSKHWDMRLDESNLQVLCHVCNKGKSNVYEDDFRAA